MKKKFIGSVLIFMIYGLIASQQIYAENKNGVDSLGILKKRVAELEEKSKSQEKRIRELEELKDLVGKLKQNEPFVTFPRNPKVEDKLKGAVPFEFNGRTYYIMPLKNSLNSTIELLGKTDQKVK